MLVIDLCRRGGQDGYTAAGLGRDTPIFTNPCMALNTDALLFQSLTSIGSIASYRASQA